jgi:hypothetical protein
MLRNKLSQRLLIAGSLKCALVVFGRSCRNRAASTQIDFWLCALLGKIFVEPVKEIDAARLFTFFLVAVAAEVFKEFSELVFYVG